MKTKTADESHSTESQGLSLPVEQIIVRDRVRKDIGNVLGLAESIGRIGLLHPVVLNKRYELIAGERRLAAVQKLGWEEVPCRVIETLDDATAALQAERDENTCREPLTPSELVEVGRQLEALEKSKAKERKKKGKGRDGSGGRGKKKPGGKFPPGPGEETGKTRDLVGAALGVSGKTYEHAKEVKTKGTAELIGAVDAGVLSISMAAKVADLSAEEQRFITGAPDPKEAALERLTRPHQVMCVVETEGGETVTVVPLAVEQKTEPENDFNLFLAQQEVFQLLLRRFERWPEDQRRHFVPAVKAILDRMEFTDPPPNDLDWESPKSP